MADGAGAGHSGGGEDGELAGGSVASCCYDSSYAQFGNTFSPPCALGETAAWALLTFPLSALSPALPAALDDFPCASAGARTGVAGQSAGTVPT